jgi:hypothetical protein
MKASKILFAAVATALVAGSAHAQSTINCGGASESAIGSACTVQNTVSADVPSVARLSITSTTTTLTAPKAADFGSAGSGNQVLSAGPTLTVAANVGHTLTASAPSTWTLQSGTTAKPSTDLQIKVNSGTMAAIGQIGTLAAATNSATYALEFGTKYNWTVDVPGTYSLALTFTLTSP